MPILRNILMATQPTNVFLCENRPSRGRKWADHQTVTPENIKLEVTEGYVCQCPFDSGVEDATKYVASPVKVTVIPR